MKEKALLTYLFATMLLITASCRHESSTTSQLQMLDTLVEVAPDSVFRILSQQNTSTYSQAELMHAELLRAKAMNKADILFTTDSTLIQVSAYYDKHGTPNQQMLAHYLLGRAYSDMGSAPRAIESFHEAAERADTTASDCDYGTLLRIHSQLAQVYSNLSLYDEEDHECDKALRYSIIIGDSNLANLFRERKLRILYINKNYDKCIRLTHNMCSLYQKQGQEGRGSAVCLNLVKTYMKMQKPDSAYKYLKIFSSTPQSTMKNLVEGKVSVYTYHAMYYQNIEEYDSALTYYRKALTFTPKADHLSAIYNGISISLEKQKEFESALYYKTLCSGLKDSLYNAAVVNNCLNVKHLYNYNVERGKADRKELESLRLKTTLLYCMFGVALLAILTIGLMYRNALTRKRMAELMFDYQSSIEQLRNLESEITYLSSEKQEIDKLLSREEDKSGELKTELSQLAGEIDQKTQTITQQRQKIQTLEYVLNQGKNTNKNMLFHNSEIVSRFRRAITSRGYTISDDDWQQLHATADFLFPNFKQQIDGKHQLSESDMRVCLLVKAGFCPSDIDFLMKMKHSYASNTRKRLHEKIFGIPGSATDFDQKIRFIQ